jgi:hypothetical protein
MSHQGPMLQNNTAVNYLGNFNPSISRVKILWQITAENCHGILSLTLKADFFAQCNKTI